MGVMLWILIGIGAGSIIAALAPRNDVQTRSDTGRIVRDVAAGSVGAVAAGYAFTFANAAAADGLTTAIVADWPPLARVIASDLALDRDVTDPVIVQRFA